MPEMMPSSPDIDGRWTCLLDGFAGDAVHEFNAWPEVTLAWAGYMGAAVAKLWDTDFGRCMAVSYEDMKGGKGFDDLDEHVTRDILGLPLDSDEARSLASRLAYCGAEALSAMRHETARQTALPKARCWARRLPRSKARWKVRWTESRLSCSRRGQRPSASPH